MTVKFKLASGKNVVVHKNMEHSYLRDGCSATTYLTGRLICPNCQYILHFYSDSTYFPCTHELQCPDCLYSMIYNHSDKTIRVSRHLTDLVARVITAHVYPNTGVDFEVIDG